MTKTKKLFYCLSIYRSADYSDLGLSIKHVKVILSRYKISGEIKGSRVFVSKKDSIVIGKLLQKNEQRGRIYQKENKGWNILRQRLGGNPLAGSFFYLMILGASCLVLLVLSIVNLIFQK